MYCILYFFLFFILNSDFGKSKLHIRDPKYLLRSVGGKDALEHEFPFILDLVLAVDSSMDTYCTGSALTPKWALTAAHCDITLEITIPPGVKNLVLWYNPSYEANGGLSEIASFIAHPGTDKTAMPSNHDIALIKTKQAMDVVKFGKLSSLDYISITGCKALAVGYGERNETTGSRLQVVEGMLSQCSLQNRINLPQSICLLPLCSARAGRAFATSGDSGGPVIHSSGIVGINSRVTVDLDSFRNILVPLIPEYPLLIANIVSPYVAWISDVIRRKKGITRKGKSKK